MKWWRPKLRLTLGLMKSKQVTEKLKRSNTEIEVHGIGGREYNSWIATNDKRQLQGSWVHPLRLCSLVREAEQGRKCGKPWL